MLLEFLNIDYREGEKATQVQEKAEIVVEVFEIRRLTQELKSILKLGKQADKTLFEDLSGLGA